MSEFVKEPRGGSLTERERLEWAVQSAARESSTASIFLHAAIAARLGLAATDEKALEILDRLGPVTAGTIAQQTGLTGAAVTSLIDRLESKGYVRRARDDRDRRKVLVELTGLHGAAVAKLLGSEIDDPSGAFARYDDGELKAIVDFLRAGAQWARERTAAITNGSAG